MSRALALLPLASLLGCPPTPPTLGEPEGRCENLPRAGFDLEASPKHPLCSPDAPLDGTDPGDAVKRFRISVNNLAGEPCTCVDPEKAGFVVFPGGVLLDVAAQKQRLIDRGELRAMCHIGGNRCDDPITRPSECSQWLIDPKGCSKVAYMSGFIL